MIYIVEIPHQRRPFCWAARSEKDFINCVAQGSIQSGIIPETFAEAEEYLGHDLSSHRIYMSAAEAIEGLESISGHGSAAAIDALRQRLIDEGEY